MKLLQKIGIGGKARGPAAPPAQPAPPAAPAAPVANAAVPINPDPAPAVLPAQAQQARYQQLMAWELLKNLQGNQESWLEIFRSPVLSGNLAALEAFQQRAEQQLRELPAHEQTGAELTRIMEKLHKELVKDWTPTHGAQQLLGCLLPTCAAREAERVQQDIPQSLADHSVEVVRQIESHAERETAACHRLGKQAFEMCSCFSLAPLMGGNTTGTTYLSSLEGLKVEGVALNSAQQWRRTIKPSSRPVDLLSDEDKADDGIVALSAMLLCQLPTMKRLNTQYHMFSKPEDPEASLSAGNLKLISLVIAGFNMLHNVTESLELLGLKPLPSTVILMRALELTVPHILAGWDAELAQAGSRLYMALSRVIAIGNSVSIGQLEEDRSRMLKMAEHHLQKIYSWLNGLTHRLGGVENNQQQVLQQMEHLEMAIGMQQP